jgi:hypothetical protein
MSTDSSLKRFLPTGASLPPKRCMASYWTTICSTTLFSICVQEICVLKNCPPSTWSLRQKTGRKENLPLQKGAFFSMLIDQERFQVEVLVDDQAVREYTDGTNTTWVCATRSSCCPRMCRFLPRLIACLSSPSYLLSRGHSHDPAEPISFSAARWNQPLQPKAPFKRR